MRGHDREHSISGGLLTILRCDGPNVMRAAAMFGSQVTLVHVCDLGSRNGFELYLRSFQEIAEHHSNVARSRLNSFLVSEFPRDTCPRLLHSGEAGAQIAEVASTGEFDLIVMPTHAG